LRGLKEGTFEWNDINLTFRDILIYNVHPLIKEAIWNISEA
jgi:hypothetical protein